MNIKIGTKNKSKGTNKIFNSRVKLKNINKMIKIKRTKTKKKKTINLYRRVKLKTIKLLQKI